MGETFCIKMTFPVGVQLDRQDQDDLMAIAERICGRYEAANPGRVMWPAGIGAEPVNIWSDEPEFDDTVFVIECFERERYDSEVRRG